MPQLGETVTEGTIIRWLKKVGDPIAHDEPLLEVSTDKVDSEVPSPASGVLSEILVPEGATVDVGTKLAVVTDATGAVGAQAQAPGATSAPVPAATTSRPSEEVTEAVVSEALTAAPAQPVAAPPVVAQAEPAAIPAEQEAEPSPQDATETESTESNGKGLVLSPVVRQLVSEYGIDPATVPGTGKGGRVTRADILSFIDRRAAAEVASPATVSAVTPAAVGPAAAAAPALASAAPAASPATAPSIIPSAPDVDASA